MCETVHKILFCEQAHGCVYGYEWLELGNCIHIFNGHFIWLSCENYKNSSPLWVGKMHIHYNVLFRKACAILSYYTFICWLMYTSSFNM